MLWRDIDDRTPRTGGVLAPLTLARDPEAYATWWQALPDTEFIADTLNALSAPDSLDCER